MKPSPIETMLRHLKGFVKAAQELIKELEEMNKEGNNDKDKISH